jgi:catechol 2,3-dioxygenase-like lactoylglutathione lyase family enzyme
VGEVLVKAALYHVQVNVGDAGNSLPFYRALLGYLGYRPVHDEDGVAGFSDGRTDLWFVGTGAPHAAAGFHRKRAGLNHLAFRVERREDVDRFAAEFLAARGIAALYDTPREFPEYAPGYYAVFFEDPDRVKLEVVHVPARGASTGGSA